MLQDSCQQQVPRGSRIAKNDLVLLAPSTIHSAGPRYSRAFGIERPGNQGFWNSKHTTSTKGSYKPWVFWNPLSWALEPECRIPMLILVYTISCSISYIYIYTSYYNISVYIHMCVCIYTCIYSLRLGGSLSFSGLWGL